MFSSGRGLLRKFFFPHAKWQIEKLNPQMKGSTQLNIEINVK